MEVEIKNKIEKETRKEEDKPEVKNNSEHVKNKNKERKKKSRNRSKKSCQERNIKKKEEICGIKRERQINLKL